jgi:uncharacterized membrane protein YphA (DoxX/SURF4 family)
MADRLMPWLGLAVRLLASGIWLVAGVAKLLDVTAFEQQISAYKMLPDGLVTTAAYGIPLLEIVLGVYLLVGALVRPAAIASCCLMLLFIVAQGQAWARGLSVDCGCFGSLHKETVGLGSVLRDVAFLVPSAILVWRPARKWSVDEHLLGRPDGFTFRSDALAPMEGP